jgi:NAD(P) transhydrogenase
VRYGAIVIGAGPAGCSAALEAANLGIEVLVVDPAAVPGAESGVPGMLAATLLRDAAVQEARRLRARGLARDPAAFRREQAALTARHAELLELHLRESRRRLEELGVHFEQGRAALRASGEVEIEGRGLFAADGVVIATGSRPRRPARFPFDHRVVCDSDSVLQMGQPWPRHVVIVGAEVVGCEFACLFAALGASVTLVDRRRRLLRCADPEILEVLHGELQELGVVVALEEEVEQLDVSLDASEPHAVVRLGSGRSEVCDRLLVVAGREASVDAAALSALGIEVDSQGFVVVDEFFQTTRPGLYAIGDVVGAPLRASVAPHHARSALLHAVGREPPQSEYPMTAYTIPEIAVVGLIEEALKRLDVPYGVGRAHFSELLRGQLDGGERGLIKLTFAREDRRLLGVQIVGRDATELIHAGAMLIQTGGTIDQLIDQVFTHPSLSEAYRAAACDAALSG